MIQNFEDFCRELNNCGFSMGGGNAKGMKKKYPTWLDETAQLWDEIAVSAGERGHQMILPPEGLASLAAAEFVDIIL